jgi:uncharacterized protein YggU (UPF0235/DUF167 family)
MAEVRLSVRVKPGASRAHVGGTYGDDELIVAVTPRPVDGAANAAVVRAVAKELGVRPHQVGIASGHTARSKLLTIEVEDADAAVVLAAIARLRNRR